ncbi:prenyltransferase/squalene oxidase repeat-containing protein [Lignipirellula cremea]|uniref:Uncharacterized protein n=1 Tax=Lignipirellula cremea TaxID=2528010 RepID=A0A518E1H5_9BACT|nr:hypothetical protein [Lignipirellula cremea]QDU97947.1 hypothetical protein Pla8534_58060 [Lignipirellula cremea]
MTWSRIVPLFLLTVATTLGVVTGVRGDEPPAPTFGILGELPLQPLGEASTGRVRRETADRLKPQQLAGESIAEKEHSKLDSFIQDMLEAQGDTPRLSQESKPERKPERTVETRPLTIKPESATEETLEDSPAEDADPVVNDGSTPPATANVGRTPSDTTPDKAEVADEDLSPQMLALRSRIRRCLGAYYARPENIADHSPWGVMHSMLSFGVDTRIYANGRRVNAVGFLCWNYPSRGQSIMFTRGGKLGMRVGPGVQGHEGQLLAMLAQSKVARDYPMQVNGQRFTVDDLIEYEKRTCRPNSELTFKLIGLSHYLKSDETWTSDQGQKWDIERLIQEELRQKIVGAACGGTHRMMGFAYSVDRRKRQGMPVTGQFVRAQRFVEDYQRYTLSLQNPDGSFSTDWFEKRENKPDEDRKLQTTGHILEWMVFSMTDEELQTPRIIKAVDFLTNLLLNERNRKLEIGPKSHAIRALVLYDQRVYGGRLGLGAGEELERLWAERQESAYQR